MSKLIATLMAAVFAFVTVAPAMAADAKKDDKMEAKKDDKGAKKDDKGAKKDDKSEAKK